MLNLSICIPGKYFCLMNTVSMFSLYNFLLCTVLGFWKHVSRLFKEKETLFLFSFYNDGSRVTKLDLLVHFVNNQSVCVKIQLLRLLTCHSECHVVLISVYCVEPSLFLNYVHLGALSNFPLHVHIIVPIMLHLIDLCQHLNWKCPKSLRALYNKLKNLCVCVHIYKYRCNY